MGSDFQPYQPTTSPTHQPTNPSIHHLTTSPPPRSVIKRNLNRTVPAETDHTVEKRPKPVECRHLVYLL